jgi:hypothetical protein
VVFTGKILFGPEPPTIHHSFWWFTSRFFSIELLGALIRQVCEKSNRRNLRMSFKKLVGESIAEAWEHYHLFVADLPVARMEDWDFTQGFYYGLSQEAKEHIDSLAGGTFFLLKTLEAQALFEKITTSERDFGVWLLTRPQQMRSIERNRNSRHSHSMESKDPSPGSVVMPS